MSGGAGTGTEVDHGSETILGGKNDVINNNIAAIGTYVRGQILAKLDTLAGVGSAKVGNTGNATFTALSIVANAKAKAGVYVITWSAATAYDVEDPDGADIGAGDIASGFASVQIDFGITVGATPMIAGDILYVTVTVSKTVHTTLVENAGDETEKPAIVCLEDITLAAEGYIMGGFGDFQRSGVAVVMAALSVAVTVDDALALACNEVGIYLKRH